MCRFRATYKDVDVEVAKQYQQGVLKCMGVKPATFQVSLLSVSFVTDSHLTCSSRPRLFGI